jgi:hypothetical protein
MLFQVQASHTAGLGDQAASKYQDSLDKAVHFICHKSG